MSTRANFFCLIGTCIVAGGLAQTTLSLEPSPTTTLPFPITIGPPHPPIPTANTPALPSEFSDIPLSVINCWDARANYSSASTFLSTELIHSETQSWSPWSTTSYSYSTYEIDNCSTTALPSLTTLCDGYPRASAKSSTCNKVPATYTFTITGTNYYYTPSWSTELEQLPSPTCTVANDFRPVCSRLKDAYEWRKSQFQLQTPMPTGSIAGPGCSVLNAPLNPKPTCFLEGGSWEAFHWPTPIPTGSAFCSANGTDATATPTIPGQANTAVVSGLTLTSPSVYHFLRNAVLKTFAGRESLVGDNPTSGQDAFAPSTTASLLTVVQRESDILTISRLCAGSGKRRYCTFDAAPGFSIADLKTVRASEYCGKWGCGESETIYQDEYTATIGIAMSDIVVQNSVFADCAWTTPGARIRTAGPPAYNGGRMKAEDWHQITATKSDLGKRAKTARPGMGVR